jgi:RNA-directed DNA polymerase
MAGLVGSNAASVMRTLTPIIRGWAAYYRIGISSEVFSALDDYMWKLLYKWIKRTHPEQVQVVADGPVLRPVQPRPQQPVGLR